MERTNVFRVKDLILGTVTLQQGNDGSYYLYVGDRDLHIAPGSTGGGVIVGSGSKIYHDPGRR